MAGSPRKYGFINAKLRTRISLILDDQAFSRLARASTLVEAVGLLRETPFSSIYDAYTATGDLRIAELELIKTEINLYRELLSSTSGDLGLLINALVGRFEGENLKAALRLWFDRHIRGRDISGEVSYLITDTIRHPMPIEQMLLVAEPSEAALCFANTPYGPLLQKLLPDVAEKQNLFACEIAIDQFFYAELYRASAQLGKADRSIAEQIIGAEIDLRNVDWIVRSRAYPELTPSEIERAMIPGGSRVSTSELDTLKGKSDPLSAVVSLLETHYPGVSLVVSTASDNSAGNLDLLESLFTEVMKKQAARILLLPPFSAGVILAYFILKGREIESLITILNAKYYELGETRIKEIL